MTETAIPLKYKQIEVLFDQKILFLLSGEQFRRKSEKLATRLQVNCTGKEVEVTVDQIRTISKKRLRQKIDQLLFLNALVTKNNHRNVW